MMEETVDGVKVYRNVDGVRCISICDLMEHFYGDTAFRGWDPAVNRSHEQETADVKAWGTAHKASFYAEGREDFSLYAAARIARTEGNTLVIVEDLS